MVWFCVSNKAGDYEKQEKLSPTSPKNRDQGRGQPLRGAEEGLRHKCPAGSRQGLWRPASGGAAPPCRTPQTSVLPLSRWFCFPVLPLGCYSAEALGCSLPTSLSHEQKQIMTFFWVQMGPLFNSYPCSSHRLATWNAAASPSSSWLACSLALLWAHHAPGCTPWPLPWLSLPLEWLNQLGAVERDPGSGHWTPCPGSCPFLLSQDLGPGCAHQQSWYAHVQNQLLGASGWVQSFPATRPCPLGPWDPDPGMMGLESPE